MSRGLFFASVFCLGLVPQPSVSATIFGSDLGGADLTVNDGDVLSGTFLNVGSFVIQSGATVFIDSGVVFEVFAQTANIAGTLNGIGSGFAGGAVNPSAAGNGLSGDGPGGGEGGLFGNGVHASGGGGGGYGGAGGNSGQSLSNPPFAAGGQSYGAPEASLVQMGSGGGSAGNHSNLAGFGGAGGAGGGAISIVTDFDLVLSGSVLADGLDGVVGSSQVCCSASSGGGGAGGGILLLSGGNLILDGILSANGGDGADFAPDQSEEDRWGQGGGGGSGGRIVLAGLQINEGSGFAASVLGGDAGLSDTITLVAATSGSDGSIYQNLTPAPVPLPMPMILLLSGLGGLVLLRRKSKAI